MQLLFTINGLPAGKPLKAPKGADDVHVQWAGGRGPWIAVVILTRDGKPVAAVFPPPGANDVDVAWTESPSGRSRIRGAFWTRDGEPIGKIPIPPRINDFHFKIIPLPGARGPVIVKAWWTSRQAFLQPIVVPKGANDFHLW